MSDDNEKINSLFRSFVEVNAQNFGEFQKLLNTKDAEIQSYRVMVYLLSRSLSETLSLLMAEMRSNGVIAEEISNNNIILSAKDALAVIEKVFGK